MNDEVKRGHQGSIICKDEHACARRAAEKRREKLESEAEHSRALLR